jgi:predicted metal-dependent phosphoesterase TrpH
MPNASIDLHLHTRYSDGRTSPAEILRHAASLGLKTVAITDHDTLKALPEAHYVAGETGLTLIPGVELTTHWKDCEPAHPGIQPGQEVDLLGYYLDWQDVKFQEYVSAAFLDLKERVEACCQSLSQAGYLVSIFDVLDVNPNFPGTAALMSALIRRQHAANLNEAYILMSEHWCRIRFSRNSLQAAIQAIHQAGGAAILAHPIAIRCRQGLLDAGSLSKLVEAGLDGLEIFHPFLTLDERQHFQALARQFDLVVTGGSDEHGSGDGFSRLGSQLVTYEMVKALQARASRYKKNNEYLYNI